MRLLNNAIYSINAAALLIGAAGLLSRILGVFRDRLLASHFGASRELDIYYAAFQIPDFLYTILALGAASAAIIPIFTGLREKDRGLAVGFIKELINLFIFVAAILSLGAVIFAPLIVPWLTPGFSADEIDQMVILTRIMMLSPIFLGLSSIISSVIQSFRLFLVFSLAGVFYNLGIIASILFFLPKLGMAGLALGVSLGALLHLIIQVPAFLSLGFRFASWQSLWSSTKTLLDTVLALFGPKSVYPILYRLISEEVRSVVQVSFPRVVAMSLNQITVIVMVAVASMLLPGSIAIFNFAYNLHFLPVGIFGVSFSLAAFPALAEYFIRKKKFEFITTFYETMRAIFFWIMPISVLFYVLRAQIVRVALGGGRFDWEDTILTAASLGIMVFAILAGSLILLLVRSFYALNNTKKPL